MKKEEKRFPVWGALGLVCLVGLFIWSSVRPAEVVVQPATETQESVDSASSQAIPEVSSSTRRQRPTRPSSKKERRVPVQRDFLEDTVPSSIAPESL